MKPEITHELKTGRALGAQRGFAATFNWMLNFCRNLTGGPGVTVDRTDSDHPIIRIGDEKTGTPAPFAVRCYRLDPDDDSITREFLGRYGWKIYLPPGCLSVGGNCEPINRKMTELDGHEDDEGDWYDLAVDEDADCGARSVTEAVPDGQGGTTDKTVWYYEWDVILHAKTSAKLWQVDELNDPARRLYYVEARPRKLASGQDRTEEQKAAGYWGDEFSQTIATFHVRTEPRTPVAKVSRKIVQTVQNAISVAGRERSNFDLEWYLSVDEDTGKLEFEKVYCRRIWTAAAGMTVTGPDYVEVTDAEATIYARLDTNGAGENVLAVVLDPSSTGGDDFVTWLKLYDMAFNVVKADYRATSLVNVQVFR